MAKVIRAIRNIKITKKARFTTPAEAYVSSWDGNMQDAPRYKRLKERREMGQQQVPIGPKGTR